MRSQRLALMSLAAVTALGCGSPLAGQKAAGLEVYVLRGVDSVFKASVQLLPADPASDCPVLTATATMNGVPLPQTEAGHRLASSLLLPSNTCAAPTYEYVVSQEGGPVIATGGLMTVSLRDTFDEMRVVSPDALTVTMALMPAAVRRAGDPLVFTVDRPGAVPGSYAEITFRDIVTQFMLNVSTYPEAHAEGDTIVAAVPSAPPGTYEWVLTPSLQVTATECVGAANCVVTTSPVATGQITIAP